MSKTVLITGASSGFGEACAYLFAKNQYHVIITGRRADRLDLVEQKINSSSNAGVSKLVFDVRDNEAVLQAFDSLNKQSISCIDVLINNAGLAAGRDSFEDASLNDWEDMIDTNVKGLLYVTKASLPFLSCGGHPHIINIGSTAGKEVYEAGNVYCATKFAVDALTKAMRIDFLEKGIKVTAINPGAAETEFSTVRFKGDQQKADAVYAGYKALSAHDVAEIVYFTTTLPQHVCINDLTVTCTAQANSFKIYKDL